MKQDDFMVDFYQPNDKVLVNANELQEVLKQNNKLRSMIATTNKEIDRLRFMLDAREAYTTIDLRG